MRNRKIVVLLLMLFGAIGLIGVILRLLSPPEGMNPTEQIKVTITDIFTASKIEIENGDLKSAEVTTRFAPTDRQIHLCYQISSSRPVSMTYSWYHGSTLVYQRGAEVESGLNCTSVIFNQSDLIPVGHYYVYFGVEGIPTNAKTEFDVVDDANKS